MKYFITLIILLLNILTIYGQHPDYYEFTEKDGLPDSEFYDMMMDSKGFIWFAANKGLYRYDGQEFKNYTNLQKRSLSVFGLLEDEKGKIWCNNLGGQVFFVENDSLKIFLDINKYTSASRLHEFRIWKNFMYITSDKGLMQVDLKTKKIDFIKSSLASDTLGQTYSLQIINDQLLYVEGSSNPRLISLRDNLPDVLYNFESDIKEIHITKNHIFLNEFFKSNFSSWNTEQKKLKKITNIPDDLSKERTVHLFEDSDGFLWLSTTKGVIRFKLEKGKMTNVQKYFTNKFVTRVLQDKKGNYWFTTYDDGIFVIPNLNVVRYTTQNSNIEINEIRAIVKDTSYNLYYTNNDNDLRKLNTKTQFFSKLKSAKIKYYPSAAKKLKYHQEINAVVLLGPRTSLWTGGHKRKLIMGSHWKNYSFLPDNKLMFSSTKESGVIDNVFLKKGVFNYQNFNEYLKDNPHRLLRKKRAYTNHFSKKNSTSYIGYIDGLYYYDEFFNEKPILHNNTPLFATDITETEDGITWASSFDYGLFGLVQGSIVIHYDTNSILNSNKVSVIRAEGNHIWAVTQKGLQQIKRSKHLDSLPEVITINKNDGLITTEILDIEIINEDVFLATKKGLIKLDKTKKYKNNIVPDIYLKSIKINNKDTILKSAYTLSYSQNIEVQYNSNSFLNPSLEKKYKYRLKGLDKYWYEKSTPFVRYSSLPSGSYTFEVKAVNEDGIESNYAATFDITIMPPYWRSWWFYTLFGIILLLMIRLVFYFRVKRIQKQNILLKQKREVELELINSKLEALRSQMNPHFLFNALNSIQEYILTNQKDLASDYLGKFADLMRIYLEHSKKNGVTIDEEIKALDLYLDLEKNRFEDSFFYEIVINDSDSFSKTYKIPPLLIQPYVENAIKHGLLHKKTDRRLAIHFSHYLEGENVILCTIEDNGVGRKRSVEINSNRLDKHTSFASNAGKNRLELLNQGNDKQIGLTIIDLTENGKALGTQVQLRIPYTK